jgi:hypothetical protein
MAVTFSVKVHQVVLTVPDDQELGGNFTASTIQRSLELPLVSSKGFASSTGDCIWRKQCVAFDWLLLK